MKPSLLLLFALLCAAVSAKPFTQPAPDATVPDAAALTGGTATIANGALTITLRSQGGDITPWVHVFIGTDPSAKPSYDHSSGHAAGRGLHLLFEGSLAYRFGGATPSVWSWTPLPGATVERAIKGDTLTLKTALAPLGLAPGSTVRLFAAAYTDNYADTLDSLPRDTGVWSLAVPK